MNRTTPSNEFDLDKKRINVLLNINSILLQQSIELYNLLSQPQNQQQNKETYQNYMKRIHSNLTMLATINEKYTNPLSYQQKQQFPQIMTPPQQLPLVFELYQTLQNLYPEGVLFYQKKLQQLQLLQQQQQQQAIPPQHQLLQQQHQVSQNISPHQVLARLNNNNSNANNTNNNSNNHSNSSIQNGSVFW